MLIRKCVACCLACLLAALPPPRPALAIPVVDITNFAQNLITALENANQTVQQLQEYRLQLLQYKELVRNTIAVPVRTWDRIHDLHDNIRALTEDLANYNGFIQETDQWLRQLKDPEYYRQATCYSPDAADCTVSEWQRILRQTQEEEGIARLQRQKSIDAMKTTLDESQKALQRDGRDLERLQRLSQGSLGQLEALQAGNELSSAQVEQMLRIRATLNAYHRVLIMERQVAMAREARSTARSQRYNRRVYKPKRYQGIDPWRIRR